MTLTTIRLKTENGDVEALIISFDSPEAGLEQKNEFKYLSQKYMDQNGCPIFRSTTEYFISLKRNSAKKQGKCHGAMCKVTQFPMRLAWACTGHKVQGITIQKGTNIVVHGHKRLPEALYYTMLSRAQVMENVFLEDFYPEKIK